MKEKDKNNNPSNIFDMQDSVDLVNKLYAETGEFKYRLLSANIAASKTFDYNPIYAEFVEREEEKESSPYDFSLITDNVIITERLKVRIKSRSENFNPTNFSSGKHKTTDPEMNM